MRLHHLSVTAFGPFAETAHVDFDELNAAGLFLLTGPTGAGKSSLLDAVCFALYGTVPGARGVKTLKSQHAAAHVPPEVVLDVTVQGRRFVVRRTPEWTRAKKRGDGLLTEKASASIIETTGGIEHFLSSRVAEVGHLVTSLMGMNAAQFQQVALLPQGEFQTFLRATSQERHAVLQHLFRTDRFSRIEDWVHDHSRRLHARASEGEATVRRLVDAVAERSAAETPEELCGDALARATADDRVLPWVVGLLAGCRAALSAATTERDLTACAVVEARVFHDEALRRLERAHRRDVALRTLDSLAQQQPAADSAAAALDAHERATRCGPVLSLLAEADRARDRTRTVVEPGRTTESLALLLDETRQRQSRLEALRPREAELDASRSEQQRDKHRLATAELEEQSARRRAQQLPAEVDAAAAELARVATWAAREEAATLALTAARVRHAAAEELTRVSARLATAEDRRRDARDSRQDSRDRVQELAARRLAGMAAELAGALREGTACQVCGSRDHPDPAPLGPDPVTQDDQVRAEADLADRTAVLDDLEAQCHALTARRDALLASSGGATLADAAEEVRARADAVRDARAAAETLPDHELALQLRREEQQTLSSRQADAAATAATLRQVVAGREQLVHRIEAELAAALGACDVPEASVAAALDRLAATADRLAADHAACLAHDQAAQRADELGRTAADAVREHGFADLDEARAALLPAPEASRLSGLLREHSDAVARADAVLTEASVEAADVDDLAQAVRDGADALAATEAAAAVAARSLVLHEDRLAALTGHHDRLVATIDQWAPQRDDALRADSISRLVRGTGHDNQLQMRLSAYVLATRLDQVVAAANERLGHMRDQRYLLQRTGRAERRSAQAGLGLEVVDQWTGDVRAPTTLSGGETFVVSLALALGLADVVTHEAGGTEVETLFVDEGFGTLDADTLDDVMDRLDGLRAGGRTVGVVSHVSELRSRIPTQVLVDKGRAGSSVTVTTLVG